MLVETNIFDKTGTLTYATPKVVDIIAFNNYSTHEVLKTAACLEEHFPHPLSRAVVQEALDKGIDHREEYAKVEYIVAHGIVSTLHDKKVAIGSYHFIFDDEKTKITKEEKEIIENAAQKCSSILYLAIGDILMGIILIDDPVIENAYKIVEGLRKSGVNQVVMITGDGEKAAANAGIAMKGSSDIAGETADIILNEKGIESLLDTRILGQNLLERISFNNKVIIAGNSLLILLGLLGKITPAVAALIHNTLTVGISINSMKPLTKDEK